MSNKCQSVSNPHICHTAPFLLVARHRYNDPSSLLDFGRDPLLTVGPTMANHQSRVAQLLWSVRCVALLRFRLAVHPNIHDV